MLSRETFRQRFGDRAVFGMVHLQPLPGAPLFGGSLAEVIDAALSDARAIAGGGADGLVVENFGDRPFYATRVPPETIASMTRVIVEIATIVKLPIGVNVLRNDARSALAIAAVAGAAFIRVNIHTGAMTTDQGIIEGDAAETLRYRERIAPDVAIFADYLVKHATPLGPQSAKDLRERGLADAIIITGPETGAAADPRRLAELRSEVDAPLIVGSGLDESNAGQYALADAAIVGTALKRDGRVDQSRVERVVRAFKAGGGR